MVELFSRRHLQGALQDAASLTRQALGGLPQQFKAGVGEQGVGTAGGFEGVLDELSEAIALQHGFRCTRT